MEEVLAELRTLREEIARLRDDFPHDRKCMGITGKGTQCRNRACESGEYCRMHMGGSGSSVMAREQVRRVRVPKVKKVQPEHTHGDGGICDLCETHGDVLDPGLVDEAFHGMSEIN